MEDNSQNGHNSTSDELDLGSLSMYEHNIHVNRKDTGVYFKEFVLHSISDDADLVVVVKIVLVFHIQKYQSYEDGHQDHGYVISKESNQGPEFV